MDGCYSFWVGGCWPLIDAVVNAGSDLEDVPGEKRPPRKTHDWFSREGLLRYIMCCAQDQSKRGGLRDKPSRYVPARSRLDAQLSVPNVEGFFELTLVLFLCLSRPSDAYHTCYVLCGLTTTQYEWDLTYIDDDETILAEPQWKVTPRIGQDQLFEEEDRISTIHPAYGIPEQKAYDMIAYFASKAGF